jgi:hypothetical protein
MSQILETLNFQEYPETALCYRVKKEYTQCEEANHGNVRISFRKQPGYAFMI